MFPNIFQVCCLHASFQFCKSAVWKSASLQSAVCSLQSAVCSLQSAVCSLQSAVCSLQSAVWKSAVCKSAVCKSAVCKSAILQSACVAHRNLTGLSIVLTHCYCLPLSVYLLCFAFKEAKQFLSKFLSTNVCFS